MALYVVLPFDPTIFLFDEGGWPRVALVIGTILIGLYLQDLYTDLFVKSRILLLQQLCLVVGSAFLVQGFLSYLDQELRVPIRVMIVGNLLSVLAIFGWRVFFSNGYLCPAGCQSRENKLLVGGSPLLEDIAGFSSRSIRRTRLHMISGYLDNAHELGTPLSGGKVLGPVQALGDIVSAIRPNRIVVGMSERRNQMPVGALLQLRFGGYVIEEAASAYERICGGRVCLKELPPLAGWIYSGELGPHRSDVLHQAILNKIIAGIAHRCSLPINCC